MDAFYASCELMRYPQLRGLPVVIGGRRQHDDDWLARLQALQPDADWHADTLHERLHQIPVAAFARLSSYVGRGVITTSTYEARQFGVGSAMGLMKAAKLCPDAILLPGDFERYRMFSRRFKAVITEIAPVMEDRGIDEVYIDFTEVPGGQQHGIVVAAHHPEGDERDVGQQRAARLRTRDAIGLILMPRAGIDPRWSQCECQRTHTRNYCSNVGC